MKDKVITVERIKDALNLISDYRFSEFGWNDMDDVFMNIDLKTVPVGYTTVPIDDTYSEELDIQAEIDILKMSFNYYLDGYLVKTDEYDSWDEFRKELECLCFDELTRVNEDMINNYLEQSGRKDEFIN